MPRVEDAEASGACTSDVQWKRRGKEDAYFGVYSDERFRKGAIGANLDAFFDTGDENVRWMLGRAERCFGPIRRGRALEFGCGVGRMTIPLARAFEAVHGLDISPDMIAEAERNAEAAGNATFALSDDALANAPGAWDLVLSYIVLQHIEPARGMILIGRLLDRVAEDGVAVLQASVTRPNNTALRRLRYHVRHRAPWLAAVNGYLRGRGWSTLTMRMSEYDPIAILRAFKARGMDDVLVSEHVQGDILTYHFTGRRRAA